MLAAIDIAVLCNSETNTDAGKFRIQYCIPVSFRCHKLSHIGFNRIILNKNTACNIFSTCNIFWRSPYTFGKFRYF